MSYDTDAQAYFTAVEAADGQPLETGVKNAINNFVVGCKSDGIWTAIKAACIMAGARTLSGALVPLVGPAPTNVNFVNGDYDRETGLKGDGTTKLIDVPFNLSTSVTQDDVHLLGYVTQASTAERFVVGSGRANTGATSITSSGTLSRSRCRNSAFGTTISVSPMIGLIGVSRSSSTEYISRAAGTSVTNSVTSQTPYNGNVQVFNGGVAPNLISDARISFYSAGDSLDLALLDSRLSTLMTALANPATYGSNLRRNNAFIGLAF